MQTRAAMQLGGRVREAEEDDDEEEAGGGRSKMGYEGKRS